MIASDIMTRRVFTTSPQTSVQEVARLLDRERISGVPVVDDRSGQLIGMITEADIIKCIYREGLTVEEIMSRQLITVDEDTAVNDIAALLTERKVKRVPVIQANGKLVGIISRADIVHAVAEGLLIIRQW